MEYHKPVLLKEVIDTLKPEKGKKYIDATIGLGGHAIPLLSEGSEVLGIDLNIRSLEIAYDRAKKAGVSSLLHIVKGNFKNIDKIAQEAGFTKVSGIVFDLGYSSFELEEEEIGLSFQKEQPLDMRLDNSLGVTASDLVNALNEKQLRDLIFLYSGEHLAGKYAKAIVKARSLKRIQTTKDLADLLKSEAPLNYENGRIHPATRTFQSLRIAVNNELENLHDALPRAAHLLLPGGVMVVIAFHSLEDKVVKTFGRNVQPRLMPLFKKPIKPSGEEIKINPRARSAVMRAFIKNND